MKSSQVSLDTYLSDYYGSKRSNPLRLGIEIEVEGENVPATGWSSKNWKVVPEGSLRSGCEFVSNSGLTTQTLSRYLDDFEQGIKGAKLDMSIRTSTHFHIPVTHLSLREIYAVLGAYYLLEDPLVAANGKQRQGNLFCLRARDAEGIFGTLRQNVRENRHFQWDQSLRYAAQNLASLAKFGTLEYRFVRGLTSRKDIELWAKNLYNMVQVGSSFGSLEEVIKAYRSKTYIEFFKMFFFEDFNKSLRQYIVSDGENLPNVILLNKALKQYEKNTAVLVPRKFVIQEDIDEIREYDPQPLKEEPKPNSWENAFLAPPPPMDLDINTGPQGPQGVYMDTGVPDNWLEEPDLDPA